MGKLGCGGVGFGVSGGVGVGFGESGEGFEGGLGVAEPTGVKVVGEGAAENGVVVDEEEGRCGSGRGGWGGSGCEWRRV